MIPAPLVTRAALATKTRRHEEEITSSFDLRLSPPAPWPRRPDNAKQLKLDHAKHKKIFFVSSCLRGPDLF
jgi:hypothetical protein